MPASDGHRLMLDGRERVDEEVGKCLQKDPRTKKGQGGCTELIPDWVEMARSLQQVWEVLKKCSSNCQPGPWSPHCRS